jgi:hypothetical protein
VAASDWNNEPQTFARAENVDVAITEVEQGPATLDRVTKFVTRH